LKMIHSLNFNQRKEKSTNIHLSKNTIGLKLFWGAGIKLLLKSYMDKKVILCVFLLYHFHFIPIIFWLILFHNYQDLFDTYYTINLSSTNILLSDFNLLWKDKAFFCRFNLLNQRNTTKDFRTKLKSILMTHL
jgi:hypothetical protein